MNLLANADNKSSKFSRRKWYFINDQNNADYEERNEDRPAIRFEAKSLNQIFVII